MNIFSSSQSQKMQTGLTLVEIMVAITISLILMAGVSQIYLSNKKTYRTTNAMSRIQENGRFAINFLAQEIRGAGNMGCLDLKSMIIKNNLDTTDSAYVEFLHNFDDGIDGTNGVENAGNSALDAPDTLVLRGTDDDGTTVDTPYMLTPAGNLKVKLPTDLVTCQIVLVSDCQRGDIFQITSNPDPSGVVGRNTGICSPGNTGAGNPIKMSTVYDEDASVFALTSRTFSIQNGVSGLPALFFDNGKIDAAGNPVGALELVEGVENMQILFGVDGVDLDTVPDYYVPWAAGLDMSKVMSIRISLLLSTTTDNIVTQSQTYAYNGSNVAAADRRMRKVFNVTVALRNRLK